MHQINQLNLILNLKFNYSDAYLLVSGTATVIGAGAGVAAIAADRNNKQAIFKNFAKFTGCINEWKTHK